MNTKKIIMSCLMSVALLCFIWLKTKNNLVETDLTLLNIEALASPERGEGHTCLGTGSLDCPSGSKVAYIATPYSIIL